MAISCDLLGDEFILFALLLPHCVTLLLRSWGRSYASSFTGRQTALSFTLPVRYGVSESSYRVALPIPLVETTTKACPITLLSSLSQTCNITLRRVAPDEVCDGH